MIFIACIYGHNTDHLAKTSDASFSSNTFITSFFTSLYHLSTQFSCQEISHAIRNFELDVYVIGYYTS